MRERIFVDREDTEGRPYTYSECGSDFGTAITTFDTHYDRMFDVVIPDFKKKVSEGSLFFNRMTRIEYFWQTENYGYVTVDSTNACGACGGDFGFDLTVPQPDFSPGSISQVEMDAYLEDRFSHLREAALLNAHAGIGVSEFAGGEFYGERDETMRYLCQLMQRLIKVLRLFTSKRARIKFMRQFGKMTTNQMANEMANLWLELRYAVRPIFFDAHAIAKLLQKGFDRSLRRTSRGRTFRDSDSGETEGNLSVWPGITVDWKSEWAWDYSVKAGCLFTVDADRLDLGGLLGLDQPASVLWELTRGSFVLDWFFTLGDYIAAYEGKSSFTVQGSWLTERYSYVSQVRASNPITDWPTRGYGDTNVELPGDGKQGVVVMVTNRIPDPQKPVFPGVAVQLDVRKYMDLVALAKTLFFKGKSK